MNKVWILLEVDKTANGSEKAIPLAGTQDKTLVNKILSLLIEYKNNCLKSGKLDLTEIRRSAVEELNPINQILNEDDDTQIINNLLDLVDIGEDKK